MAKAQAQPFMLIDLFILKYEQKTRRKPTINRYREKWGFQDMIDSVGFDRAKELVEYYFETSNSWSPSNLFNIFDRLDDALTKRDADRARRAKLLAETKKMVEDWDKTHEH